MPIYINRHHIPADRGLPYKHLTRTCPALVATGEHGFAIAHVKNDDHKKPESQHIRRRCPHCFRPAAPVTTTAPVPPRFLDDARRLGAAHPDAFWVYNLHDATRRDAQVGMATDLHARLRSRWTASLKPGFNQDGIPWLNAYLTTNPGYQPTLTATAHPTKPEALAAEKALRAKLLSEGWNVTSYR